MLHTRNLGTGMTVVIWIATLRAEFRGGPADRTLSGERALERTEQVSLRSNFILNEHHAQGTLTSQDTLR